MSKQQPEDHEGDSEKNPPLPVPRSAEATVLESSKNYGENPSREASEREKQGKDFVTATRDFAAGMGRVAQASWLVGLVGVGTLITSITQCTFNQAQVEEMRKGTEYARITAVAAEKAYLASEAAIKLASEQFRTDQRPLIIVDAITLKGGLRSDGPWEFEVKLKNTGKTPALGVKRYLVFGVGINAPDISDLEKIRQTAEPSSVIGPGQDDRLSVSDSFRLNGKKVAPLKVNAQQIESIMTGKTRLYFGAVFFYRSLWGENYHTTTIGYYSPELGGIVPAETGHDIK